MKKMKRFIVSIALAASLFMLGCPIQPVTTTTSLDEIITSTTIYVDHGSSFVGVSTSSFSDEHLNVAGLNLIKPKFMRYYLGSTIVFDKSAEPKGVASIRDSNYYHNGEFTTIMSSNMSGWDYTPQLDFDEFIALCKTLGAEPVVLLPIYAAYYTGVGAHMTDEELYTAHEDFVRYANVTKKYGVKYWEIGNEDDIHANNGNSVLTATVPVYAAIFNALVPRLKAVNDEATENHVELECGANTFWDTSRWKALLPLIKANMGFAVVHQYSAFTTYEMFRDLDVERINLTDDFDSYNQIFVDHFNKARTELNDPAIPSKVLVTELSSHCTYEPANPKNNSLWKGLHNIQLLLINASRPNVLGTMNWVTWYAGTIDKTFNVFTDDQQDTLSPVGMTLSVVGDHLYPVTKTRLQPAPNVELWVSHSQDWSKMSVFILNRSKYVRTLDLNIADFVGDSTKSTKWVYSAAALDEWSQSPYYNRYNSNLTSVVDARVTVPPLSCTIYDFDGVNG